MSAWTALKAAQHLCVSGRTGWTKNDVKQLQNGVVLEETQYSCFGTTSQSLRGRREHFFPVPELDCNAATALEGAFVPSNEGW